MGEKIKFIFLSSFLPYSIPIIIREIKNRKKEAFYVVAFILALLSYVYWPSSTNDKATYYEYYTLYSTMQLSEFMIFLQMERADYLFHFLIFSFSALHIPLHFLILLITFITVAIWIHVFYDITSKSDFFTKNIIFFLVLLIISFSFSHLFSGIRFYFAVSFTMLSFYNTFIKNENIIGGIFLVLFAAIVHFSCFIYIPIFFTLYIFRRKFLLFKWLFFLSLLFWLIPKEFLYQQFGGLNLIETRQLRIDTYLGNDDLIQIGLQTFNRNYYINFVITKLWVYFSIIYVLTTLKRDSLMRNVFFISFAISNLFYSAPMVFERYMLFAKGLFVLLIVFENFNNYKIHSIVKIIYLIMLLTFSSNLYIARESYVKGILKIENITLPTLLMQRDYTSTDFY